MDCSENKNDPHGDGGEGPPRTKEGKLASACGELLGVVLGATATVAVAGIHGIVLLLDISRKALMRSCYQDTTTVEYEPVSYYVAAQPLPVATAPTYAAVPPPAAAAPQRIVVPRTSSGYYSSSHGTFTPMHHYHT